MMLFFWKFWDSLANPKSEQNLLAINILKEEPVRFECILPFVSVNLILIETMELSSENSATDIA